MRLQEPRTGTVSIFKMFPPNQHLSELQSGILARGAMTEAVESLIAQLNSQSKPATPRRENKKIDTKSEL
jgi:hypothetical protein